MRLAPRRIPWPFWRDVPRRGGAGPGSARTVAVAWVLGIAACNDPSPKPMASDEPREITKLMDPETCRECHPVHFSQWQGSMHAYAAEDPIFRAMNERGQRETQGALGDFCIKCHAPLAVELGYTKDGTNLDEVPKALHGITCYFCHQVQEVAGTHNNPLVVAYDDVMRGGIGSPFQKSPEPAPFPNDAHKSKYSALHDLDSPESASLCGSCHDVVTPAGVHLERTFAEWKGTFFADSAQLQTCGSCHMKGAGKSVIAETKDGPVGGNRRRHEHYMTGPDVALTDFPGMEEQAQKREEGRAGAMCSQICAKFTDGGKKTEVQIYLHNERAGHRFPSGALQDRRLWFQLEATAGGKTLFETGVVPKGVPVVDVAAQDPNLWLIRDQTFDEAGHPAHMFWDVRKSSCADDPDSELCGLNIADALGTCADAPMWRTRTYRFDGVPSEISLRANLQPMGLDVLNDLVESGDLDPAIADRMPTHEVDLDGMTEGVQGLVWDAKTAKPSGGPDAQYLPAEPGWLCVGSSNRCLPPNEAVVCKK